MPEAIATREAAGLKTPYRDAFELDYSTMVYDGLIASPPCQSFSTAGKGGGRQVLDTILAFIDRFYSFFPENWPTRDELRAALGDDRTALVLEPLRAALEIRPGWIAWEQVPPVLPIWEACADVLRFNGYHVATGNLQAEQFGVPQTRKRAILVAHRDRPVSLPTPTHSKYYPRNPSKLDEGVLPWVSIAEALGWGITGRPSPTITGGGVDHGGSADPIPHLKRWAGRDDWVLRNKVGRNRVVTGNFTAKHNREPGESEPYTRDVEAPAPTVSGNVNRWKFADAGATSEQTAGQIPRDIEEPAHTVTSKGTAAWVLRNNTSKNAAEREMDQPAPTMYFGQRANGVHWTHSRPATTVNADPRISKPGRHDPNESGSQQRGAIRVTVEEAGVLQSFPQGYPWQGAKTKQYLQCGNAIPPLLARAVLAQVVGAEAVVSDTEEVAA